MCQWHSHVGQVSVRDFDGEPLAEDVAPDQYRKRGEYPTNGAIDHRNQVSECCQGKEIKSAYQSSLSSPQTRSWPWASVATGRPVNWAPDFDQACICSLSIPPACSSSMTRRACRSSGTAKKILRSMEKSSEAKRRCSSSSSTRWCEQMQADNQPFYSENNIVSFFLVATATRLANPSRIHGKQPSENLFLGGNRSPCAFPGAGLIPAQVSAALHRSGQQPCARGSRPSIG